MNGVRKALLVLLSCRINDWLRSDGRLRRELAGAGVKTFVHGGSTDLLVRAPWFLRARGLGDLDLLMADDGRYNRAAAETVVCAILQEVVARIGGIFSEVSDASEGAKRARRADLESRFGLRSYIVSFRCTPPAVLADAAANADAVLFPDEREQLFGAQPVACELKVSVKYGNRNGNLRPLLPYREPEPERTGGMLALDPRCRFVTKLYYTLNPLSPEREKHLCDVALLTAGDKPIVRLSDPWVRKLFLAFVPILSGKASFGDIDFAFLTDTRVDVALAQDLEWLVASGRLNLPRSLAPARELIEQTRRTTAAIFGIEQASNGRGWTHNLTDIEEQYISYAVRGGNDEDYPAELQRLATAMLQDIPCDELERAAFVDRLVYTIPRFRIGVTL